MMSNALLASQIKTELRLERELTTFLTKERSGTIGLFVRQGSLKRITMLTEPVNVFEEEASASSNGLLKERHSYLFQLVSQIVRRSDRFDYGYIFVNYIASPDGKTFICNVRFQNEIHLP
ncbi:hypothetical protein [Alkalihalophilus pseudofirmus]|nr:hypothetical protein [Alkalihalophilus pseudofirmus]